ncbi:hypothetical protein ACG04Q_13970 [Roseateles sp. DXS20W]|uniref:Uncharacterized protein n=1 Tax=Pelomonas lactea TaxID=3299030 RepID=A0ABW7GL53_9BURK
MPPSFINRLASFNNPHDEGQLRELDETISAVRPEACGDLEVREMLAVFERFPDDDGYGVFWSTLHCLEKCHGYERLLVESASRAPAEFNLNMVNRLLNYGAAEVEGLPLLSVLESAANHPCASSNTREFARSFIEFQRKRISP